MVSAVESEVREMENNSTGNVMEINPDSIAEMVIGTKERK